MKALTYQGTKDVRVEEVPDPKIQDPTDVIVKVTLAAICGSDSHLYDGHLPTLEQGDILGHEFMGEVIEAGSEVKNLNVGDRIVVPFPIGCGVCEYCTKGLWALCDTSNKNEKAELMFGYAPAGIYGYSHLFGGYAGGQAELVRVPYADANHYKIPAEISDEQALFLGDIFPTGYMAAENCGIIPGKTTVAVWGCGPVGQFAIRCAKVLGAKQIIAVDRHPERLAMAEAGGAEVINDEEHKGTDVFKRLKEMTGGRGVDAAIDAVGMEAHGTGILPSIVGAIDTIKQSVMPGVDKGNALREVIYATRKGGTVSIAGAYAGMVDNFPMGIAFNKGLTFKMGQTHVQSYFPKLMELIQKGEIDPSFVITHRMALSEAAEGYEKFKKRDDACIKVVLKP